MLICHGQITVGRAQIPKYQREADQPFRCAIATSQCEGTRARYKPTWKLSALWHSGEWVLIVEASPVDKTDIIIHVQPSMHEAFVSKFQADWQQWGGQKGQTKQYRPQNHFRITSVPLTAEKAAEYDEKSQQLQTAGKQTVQPMETDAANATPTVSQPKGAGRGGQVDHHQHSMHLLPHTLVTTISTGAHVSRRRAGEPGRPRGSTQVLTISSTDHFLHRQTTAQQASAQTERNESVQQTGQGSDAARLSGSANRKAARATYRRGYRWCLANIAGLSEEEDRGSVGDCLVHLEHLVAKVFERRAFASDHAPLRRTPQPLQTPHCTPPDTVCPTATDGTYNVRSLLKPTMHCQLTQYMKTHQVSVLCLQETNIL